MVFGVNGGSMKSHLRFSEKHGFPFDLLVDAGSAVALAYDVRILHNHYTRRTVVGVDKSGVVVYYQRGMPSTDDILRGVTGGAEVHFID